jgi:hypothetical protein
MNHPAPAVLSLSLAWEFSSVLLGDFQRDRPSVVHKRFPVLGPRPDAGLNTQPLENKSAPGPFIYFVYSATGEIKYIGKADEKTVLYRWIRPDKRTGVYQWSHGTNSATKRATTEQIASEIRAGRTPVRLYFANATLLRASVSKRAVALGIPPGEVHSVSAVDFVSALEHYLIHAFQPQWNSQRKSAPPEGFIKSCGDFWRITVLATGNSAL